MYVLIKVMFALSVEDYKYMVAGVGLVMLFIEISRFLCTLCKHFLNFIWFTVFNSNNENLEQYLSYKAGESWALVTGGSDGIGLEMARQLANDYKYNICIMARNEQKIKQKLKEIENEFKVKTKCLVTDFSKLTSIYQYR